MEHDKAWFDRVLAQDKKNGYDTDLIKTQVKDLSEWYDKTPSTINTETGTLWEMYASLSRYHAKRLCHAYNVETEYITGQPYLTPIEMFRDIDMGTLKVSTDNNNHPILSKNENMYARVWHDMTHYEVCTDFGFMGEYRTCRAQMRHAGLNDLMSHVLFCDIVLQVAWGLEHREFPPQKVFTLKQGRNIPCVIL